MLSQKFNHNILKYIAQWHSIDGHDTFSIKHAWYKRQYHYLKIRYQLKRVIKRFSEEDFSSESLDLSRLKDDPTLTKLLEAWLQFDVKQLEHTLNGDYAQATEQFINRARSLWPEMPQSEIFQALRNVWIMIAIQIIAKVPVKLTDAMFAYSMLYPLTDNVIDHPELSEADKAAFVKRLGMRLNGLPIEHISKHEKDAFDMVALIESMFNRAQYPEVYSSILLIHDAQKRSISQQYEALDVNDIMQLSFEKGAASVIADGYLVLGHLTDAFLEFLTAYGIVLQLADDLQDIEDDAKIGHKTLFNSQQSRKQLAEITEKLSALSMEILDRIPTDDVALKAQMATLLGKSMQVLICDAIQQHEMLYTKPFYKHVNASHITGLKNHARLRDMTQTLTKKTFY
jgi:hypothetical protein